MTPLKAWAMLISAGLLAGCQSTGGASECDGWRKLTPAAATRRVILADDRPFANQVAAHNTFGVKRGCWR